MAKECVCGVCYYALQNSGYHMKKLVIHWWWPSLGWRQHGSLNIGDDLEEHFEVWVVGGWGVGGEQQVVHSDRHVDWALDFGWRLVSADGQGAGGWKKRWIRWGADILGFWSFGLEASDLLISQAWRSVPKLCLCKTCFFVCLISIDF